MLEQFWALLGWMNGFCTSKGHELWGAMGRMVSFLRWLIHQYFHFLNSRVSIQLSFFDLSIALGTVPNFTLKFSQFLSNSPIPVYPFSFSLNLTFTFSHFYLFFFPLSLSVNNDVSPEFDLEKLNSLTLSYDFIISDKLPSLCAALNPKSKLALQVTALLKPSTIIIWASIIIS